jgi:hypothetical protein
MATSTHVATSISASLITASQNEEPRTSSPPHFPFLGLCMKSNVRYPPQPVLVLTLLLSKVILPVVFDLTMTGQSVSRVGWSMGRECRFSTKTTEYIALL